MEGTCIREVMSTVRVWLHARKEGCVCTLSVRLKQFIRAFEGHGSQHRKVGHSPWCWASSGWPRRALIRCVGGHGRQGCCNEGCVIHQQMTHARTPHPTTFHTHTHTLAPSHSGSVGDRKESATSYRGATRCQTPHTRGGKRVRWRDGGATICHTGDPRKGGWGFG
jgi:hypothetical protein